MIVFGFGEVFGGLITGSLSDKYGPRFGGIFCILIIISMTAVVIFSIIRM